MYSESFEAPSLEYLAERLPHYAFEAFIAQGGMGAVYKARQISLDRDVAIKVLPDELREDADFRASFAKEAKAMAKVNHTNLISVFDFGEVDGVPYIVMEYIEGCTLHESAWNVTVEPTQAATIIKGICDGLANAHSLGIIHRDIKPANILLTTNAEPKIGDFGLAHAVGSVQSGVVMGTPGYTAPEIFVNPDLAGPLADIYSVGMIFHQLLTGIDPAGTEGPPTQLSGNARLDAIWRKATRTNPSERYWAVADMAEDLQKWLNDKTDTSPAPQAAGPISRPPQPQRAPVVIIKNNSGGLVSMIFKVAAVGALLAVGWYAYGQYQKDQGSGNQPIVTTNPAPSGSNTQPPPPKPVEMTTTGNPNADPTPSPIPDPPVTTNPLSSKPKPVEVVKQDAPTQNPTPPANQAHETVDLPPGDPVLRERAITLIGEARKKRNALIIKNAKPLQSVLRNQARQADKADADFLNQFADACNSGWMPDPATMPELSPVIATAYQKAQRDQLAIETSHQTELTRIRDFYVPKLRQTAAQTSDPQLKERLIAQADSASDMTAWIAKLAPEPERTPVSIKAPMRGFVGHWDAKTNDETQWIADKDGVITINSGSWKGKTANWKMLPDGTVEIHWADKPRPYTLSPNGTGWTGKTSFGTPLTVTPGKW